MGASEFQNAMKKTENEQVSRLGGPQTVSASSGVQLPTAPRSISTKLQVLGSHNRPTHMNTSAVAGQHPMTNVVYGFRPESGWSGVLFQVFLQDPFITNWKKESELQFWIAFEGATMPAQFCETSSEVSLPDLGTKRYVLQCVVPEKVGRDRCPVTLSVQGVGGKGIVQALFMGYFNYVLNDGTLVTYRHYGNMVRLLKWLASSPPQDIDRLSPINRNEVRESGEENIVEIVGEPGSIKAEQNFLDLQFLPDTCEYPHYSLDNQIWPMHSKDTTSETSQPESQIHQELYNPYYSPNISMTAAPDLELHFNPSDIRTGQQGSEVSPMHFGSDPQSYPVTQGALSEPSTAGQRAPSAIFRLPYTPSRGYGKLNFIQKPDQLGDYNTWTYQERQDHRRIVAFHKINRGDIIQIDCFPVPAHEYKEDMVTISCIHWIPCPEGEVPHKLDGKCVFTSVDIILLLEKLVNYSFKVQEKNRIRRNLEGFHPETIKKEGATNRFFNQVMSYAQPKTRNIEKDIKVFLWSDITKALRKIVQKYHIDGGVPLGRPNTESNISSHALKSFSPNTSQSAGTSSERLPTSFTYPGMGEEYHHQLLDWHQSQTMRPAEFTYPLDLQTQDPTEPVYMLPSEGGGSSSSISPQSQVSHIEVQAEPPLVAGANSGDGEQELEEFIRDIPEDFTL